MSIQILPNTIAFVNMEAEVGDGRMTVVLPNDDRKIERGGGVAVWRQVAGLLREDIRDGRLGDDNRLPTEAVLAERFSVNRHTVRRAIAALSEQGLVRVEQGRGAFALDVVIDYPLSDRTRFSASLIEQGREPAHDVMAVSVVEADRHLAEKLGLKSGTKLIRSEAIGLADGVPLNLSQSFFPGKRFPRLDAVLEREKSITRALATFGLTDYRRRETRIITRLPSEEEARALRQQAHQPVLVTEAVDVDPEGKPIRFGRSCFAGARVQITVEGDNPV